MTRIGIDFTRVRSDHTTTVSVERLRDELGFVPSVGAQVEVYEEDGQSCEARVIKVNTYTVDLAL